MGVPQKRKNIFAKNQIPESWLFKREILLGGFEIRNMFKKSREQASYFEKFRNPSVCSCVGDTENQIFDLLQDEFQKNLPIIIISQCVLCSIQNSKPGRVVVVNFKRFLNFFREIKSIYFTKNSMDFCEISMLLLLPSSFGNVQSCVSISWLKNYPLLATSRGRCLLATSKKIQNSKICTHKIEKIRETATTTIFYPPLVWLSLSRARVNSSVISIIQSCDLYYKIIIFYLGCKKTGCRRRNVLKEDLVAEDLNPGVGELFWARLPGYGQKKPEVPMGAWVSNGLDYYGNLV